MVKKILIVLAIFIVISLVILWFVSGGAGAIAQQARVLTGLSENATGTRGTFRLPWQPNLMIGPAVSYTDSPAEEERATERELASLQKEYESLEEAVREAREFGTPSPYRDNVYIEGKGGSLKTSVDAEYLRLVAARNNTAPVNITGWSLQSALSGVRAFLPRGASNFIMGTVNTQENIQLNPGVSATVVSGYSPLGTSFRENLCSGYLNQLQTFTPRLQERCPSPYEIVPLTAENLNTYGDTCIDFVRNLPACEAPLEKFTPSLSIQCRNFLADTLSYNGCVDMYRYRTNFVQNAWRVYLNSSRELWRNSHEVIRLLDAEGRTVDAITY